MNNEIEVITIDEWQLQEYFNKGYEFVATMQESMVQMQNIQEEVPNMQVWISNNTTSNNGYNQQTAYVNKQVPVSVLTTRFVVKRTKAAKLLYEKSLNENRT